MKIAFVTNGMASTLHSGLEFARRLRADGHQIAFFGTRDVRERVEMTGFPFTRLDADERFVEEAGEGSLPWSALVRPGRWWKEFRRLRRLRRASIANDQIESEVAAFGPDLVVIDVEMHFAVIVLSALGVPIVLTSVFMALVRERGLPPLHTDLRPPTNLRERLRVEGAWLRLRVRATWALWRGRASRLLRGRFGLPVRYETFWLDDLRALARDRGFHLRRATDRSQWLAPYLYRRLPILSFNAWEMELPMPPRANIHYVGPMVGSAAGDAEGPPEWAGLLRVRRENGDHRPMVYCSLGSFWQSDTAFLKRVIGVFKERPDWQLVVGLGGQAVIGELGELPDNVVAMDWAPQLQILQTADAAITHGGVTSLNECVSTGTPMLMVSTGHVDQNGDAVRAAHHGLAILADREEDDRQALEWKIQRVLSDRALLASVSAMRDRVESYRAENAAVETLYRILDEN